MVVGRHRGGIMSGEREVGREEEGPIVGGRGRGRERPEEGERGG